MKFSAVCSTAAAVTALICASAQSAETDPNSIETLDAITVTATPAEPATIRLDTDVLPVARDTADMLRDIPGVSGSRLGGHGTDPVIRGLGQTRINILLDGAYIHGGCPNRMDPPTAYAPASSYEDITVIKGVRSLEFGSGGPGGTIIFERVTPRFVDGEGVRGRIDAGYRENGDGRDLAADIAAGASMGFGRLVASYSKSNNYDDGGGNEVRSAFEERTGSLILGYTPDDDTRLEFNVERQALRDVLFAGAGMDSPKSDNDTYRLKFVTTELPGRLETLRADVYRSGVDHVMDNYTLREAANPMMLMRAPSSSDTTGGRLVTEIDSRFGVWKLGIDLQDNARDAIRVNDFNATLNSVLWPDVSIDQRGLFAELMHEPGYADRIIAGLRYDHVTADAGKAAVDPAGMALSPNALYAIYYDGTQAKKDREHNWGGLLRWEHDLEDGNSTLYAGFSRSMRTADATERFIASNAMTPDGRWVGNPGIDPERHHQLEAGMLHRQDSWDIEASLYYNDVQDFILRDRFHETGNNATIYRNVDATLIGGEVTAGYRWSSRWHSRLGIAYVHAENDTDDQPIAQTPPLEAIASLDYKTGAWDAGARLRGAARQTRVDDDPLTGSGLDKGKTPGWAVLDLYGHYRISERIKLDGGIDNVFDKEYAQHLNSASAFDPDQVQVNEPGRSAWLKFNASF